MTDGGSAFPRPDSFVFKDGSQGMSLRDYFAAKAMQVYLASGKEFLLSEGNKLSVQVKAYQLADAMLREREKNDLKSK